MSNRLRASDVEPGYSVSLTARSGHGHPHRAPPPAAWKTSGRLSKPTTPAGQVTRGAAPLPANYSNTQELGALLYSKYAYPFEIAAMVLLVAIVAAITLTLRHRPNLKVQNIGRQVSARASERVRLVKMDAERRE